MFWKANLVKALNKWTKKGGDLSSHSDSPVKTEAEAKAVCEALKVLRTEPDRGNDDVIGSPLHTLAAFFQKVETKEAMSVLRDDGLPLLRTYVRELLDGQEVDEDDVMFILKILAMYRQREDVDLIAEVARKSINDGGFLWSVIFGQFGEEHPHTDAMVDALRDPLPKGFILVTYLDMSNQLAIAGKLAQHPFDSESGRKQLQAWLSDENERNFSYAHSATAALPFIGASSRDELLQVAYQHPDPSVRMEAMWASAKAGDPAGVDQLAELCQDPIHSHTARRYLDELGHGDRVPAEAQEPEFQAVAEMASWLAHPSEFGRPPDHIELIDTRSLFWPPTDDTRQMFLVAYTYDDDDEPDRGVGMVGSITFALFGETTADLPPEDIYGLHCCWELEMNEDSRAPQQRTAAAGRKILAKRNAGF